MWANSSGIRRTGCGVGSTVSVLVGDAKAKHGVGVSDWGSARVREDNGGLGVCSFSFGFVIASGCCVCGRVLDVVQCCV